MKRAAKSPAQRKAPRSEKPRAAKSPAQRKAPRSKKPRAAKVWD